MKLTTHSGQGPGKTFGITFAVAALAISGLAMAPSATLAADDATLTHPSVYTNTTGKVEVIYVAGQTPTTFTSTQMDAGLTEKMITAADLDVETGPLLDLIARGLVDLDGDGTFTVPEFRTATLYAFKQLGHPLADADLIALDDFIATHVGTWQEAALQSEIRVVDYAKGYGEGWDQHVPFLSSMSANEGEDPGHADWEITVLSSAHGGGSGMIPASDLFQGDAVKVDLLHAAPNIWTHGGAEMVAAAPGLMTPGLDATYVAQG